MTNKLFAYYRTTDNTIAEQELQHYDPTSGTYGRDVARAYAETFGFALLELTFTQWDNGNWERNYAALEADGYYTRERQEELFDTVIVGTLDRLDI